MKVNAVFAGRASRILAMMAAAGMMVLASVGASFAAESPFPKMKGNWRCSNCWVKPIDGARERVSCRASYNVSGAGQRLTQSINCRGGISLSVNATITNKSGKVTGDWTSHNSHTGRVKGGATGVARANAVSLGITGTSGGKRFVGRMRARVSGRTHTVKLYQNQNGKSHLVGSLSLKR